MQRGIASLFILLLLFKISDGAGKKSRRDPEEPPPANTDSLNQAKVDSTAGTGQADPAAAQVKAGVGSNDRMPRSPPFSFPFSLYISLTH